MYRKEERHNTEAHNYEYSNVLTMWRSRAEDGFRGSIFQIVGTDPGRSLCLEPSTCKLLSKQMNGTYQKFPFGFKIRAVDANKSDPFILITYPRLTRLHRNASLKIRFIAATLYDTVMSRHNENRCAGVAEISWRDLRTVIRKLDMCAWLVESLTSHLVIAWANLEKKYSWKK